MSSDKLRNNELYNEIATKNATTIFTLYQNAMELYMNNSYPETLLKIPDSLRYDSCYDYYLEYMRMREKYTKNCGFALVTNEISKILADYIRDRKVLEIMGGSGLLAKSLNDNGVNIICTDNLSWENGDFNIWENHLYPIENIDAIKAIEKYGKDVSFIIMSWAPYADPIAVEAYDTMKRVNPDCMMIYIGEDYGGCTACDEFFDKAKLSYYAIFDDDEDPEEPELFTLFDKKTIDVTKELYTKYPQWYGIHDFISFVK